LESPFSKKLFWCLSYSKEDQFENEHLIDDFPCGFNISLYDFRQGFQEVGEEVFASAYPSTFLALNFSKKIAP
jgi:hypothetical protein